MLAIGLVLWWSAGLHPALGSLRMGWSSDFPLMIGNERDGSRPWLGEIRYAGVYGRALSGEAVSRLLKALETGGKREDADELGLLVGYDFRRGRSASIGPEGALRSDDRLVLEVPRGGEWLASGGLMLREPSILITRDRPPL